MSDRDDYWWEQRYEAMFLHMHGHMSWEPCNANCVAAAESNRVSR